MIPVDIFSLHWLFFCMLSVFFISLHPLKFPVVDILLTLIKWGNTIKFLSDSIYSLHSRVIK